MDQLHLFSSGSANNELYKELWVKGASLFIPQLNKLLAHTDYNFNIININVFNNENSDKLGYILEQNRSDKSTCHDYHILYSFIFNQIGEQINLLEIGLGTNNPNLVSSMGSYGRPGASLYAFRDYLPKANIYGGDIDKYILFESERIKTCYVDQLEIKSFDNIAIQFGEMKYDLIIDDGLHSIGANLNTLLFALDNLNDNGWIVIEDIHIVDNWRAIDFILSSTNKYKTYVVKTRGGTSFLYVINKL